jgi:hypothetical protein
VRTGAEAFGLGVAQVSFVECIEKVCGKEKSATRILMMMTSETVSMERVDRYMRRIGRLTHEGQDGQDSDIKLEAQSTLGGMVDDARSLFHEAILLALHPVEMVGAHVLGHGVVDVVRPHDGDGFSFFYSTCFPQRMA